MRLKDKVAIITGAGRGIGKGIALAYAKEGAKLSLNVFGLSTTEIDSLRKELLEITPHIVITEGDITDVNVVQTLVKNTIDEYERIDILVNNAGINNQANIKDLSIEKWRQMIEVNLTSIFLTTRHVVNYMIKQRSGRIINIASQLGIKGGYEQSHYVASKAGVVGFTKGIAHDLGEYGITANCIAPGPIETDILSCHTEEWLKDKKQHLTLNRFGKVHEVAPTAVFLASDPDGNIFTGQTLGPNSGDVMP